MLLNAGIVSIDIQVMSGQYLSVMNHRLVTMSSGSLIRLPDDLTIDINFL